MDSATRIDRMEQILKDHQMHESSCSVRSAQKHNAMGGSYMVARECTCWLASEESK